MNFIQALSVSPTQINFDLMKGERKCDIVGISNDKIMNLKGSDKWTNDIDSKGKLSEYTMPASALDIEIDYQKQITNTQSKDIEVCITGNRVGEYFGALIYQSDSSGGVSAGVGIWLMINVLEPIKAPAPEETGNQQRSSGSSGNSRIEPIILPKENNKKDFILLGSESVQESELTEMSLEGYEQKAQITGDVISWKGKIKIIIVVFAITIIIGGYIYLKFKRKNNE